MGATCAAASGVLTVMRTSSEPARASASTCSAVAAASAVSVLVIDCTTMGASPPMSTSPTATWRETRRFMAGSFQGESGDFDRGVRAQVDGLAVVGELHRARVADHDVKRRGAAHHALGAGGVERRDQHAPRAVLDLEPGFALGAQHDAVRSRRERLVRFLGGRDFFAWGSSLGEHRGGGLLLRSRLLLRNGLLLCGGL